MTRVSEVFFRESFATLVITDWRQPDTYCYDSS